MNDYRIIETGRRYGRYEIQVKGWFGWREAGDDYWVARSDDLEHLKKIVDGWRNPPTHKVIY